MCDALLCLLPQLPHHTQLLLPPFPPRGLTPSGVLPWLYGISTVLPPACTTTRLPELSTVTSCPAQVPEGVDGWMEGMDWQQGTKHSNAQEWMDGLGGSRAQNAARHRHREGELQAEQVVLNNTGRVSSAVERGGGAQAATCARGSRVHLRHTSHVD
jgi:hypothetical protein